MPCTDDTYCGIQTLDAGYVADGEWNSATNQNGFVASNNFIGFNRMGTGAATMTFKYQRVGGTESQKTDVVPLVADTYVKLGVRYHAARKECSIWVNGAEVTASRVSSTITGATPWPSLYMNFLAAVQYQATAAHILYIDWWACAQQL